MKPRTITCTLVAIVVVLQLISLMAITHGTQVRLHDQAKLLAVHELDAKAKSLIIQAQQFLAPIKSQLSISRQLVADGLLSTKTNDTLERYFLSQLRSNLAMNSMYLGRYDGSYVAVTRFDNSLLTDYNKPVFRAKVSSIVNDDVRRIEWREYSLLGKVLNSWTDENDVYDPRQREWYTIAQVHDIPVWTNAYSLVDSRKLNIAASVNLRDQSDTDAGVLGVSVDLTQLSALVSAIPTSLQVSAVILDSNLNQIAASIPRSSKASREVPERAGKSLWSEGFVDQRSRSRFMPPIDAPGNRLSAVDRHWFSDNDSQANVQRRIQLFDGALHWRVLLQSPVIEIENIHKSVMLEGMYRTMGIILLPGAIALLLIFGLSSPLQRLYKRATIDYLTKALNRGEFVSRFSKRLTKVDQGKDVNAKWVAVVLDLDGFKQINDRHGHDAGDGILKTVVCRLQKIVDRPGFVGRLGGDEFSIAIRLQPGVDARSAVERVRRMVVHEPIYSAQVLHKIGMTAGVAIARQSEPVAELLDRADRALISGKAIAKNTTYLATEALPKIKPIPGRAYQKTDDLAIPLYREVRTQTS